MVYDFWQRRCDYKLTLDYKVKKILKQRECAQAIENNMLFYAWEWFPDGETPCYRSRSIF